MRAAVTFTKSIRSFPTAQSWATCSTARRMRGAASWDACSHRFIASAARSAMKRLSQAADLQPQDFNKYPHQLSGGMQQRVAIAQALLMKPPVLLMDEAFSALDPSTRSSLQEQLHRIWTESRPTVIFVTHNTAEALLMGTRLILLGRQREGSSARKNLLLDMEIPTARLPFAARKKNSEFQQLQEYVADLAHRSSSMCVDEEPAESPVEGNLR